MGQRELDDIVDEIDVDGNGVYTVFARHRREIAPESDPSGLDAIDAWQNRADGVNGARHTQLEVFGDAESLIMKTQARSTSRSFCS